MAKARKTPGVYITELDAFPPSVVGVQTAVPAFVGYTEKAEVSGKPVYNQAIAINSMVEYEEVFGGMGKALFDIETVAAPSPPDEYDFKVCDGKGDSCTYYRLAQIHTSRFNLYNSLQLFYANGGGSCYVASVGSYADASSGVVLEDLEKGLAALSEQVGPTMIVIPDAVLLPPTAPDDPTKSSAFQTLVRAMLNQSGTLQDRVALLDVYGVEHLDPDDQQALDAIITQFRADVGDQFLNYGMDYFPYLNTSIVEADDVDYANINLSDAGQLAQLKAILKQESANLYGGTPKQQTVDKQIDEIAADNTPAQVTTLNQNLTSALPLFQEIENLIVGQLSVLPPSGAMAGVYTQIDGSRGVWNAPANVTLTAVVSPTFPLTDAQQGDLNVPLDGKAVNALREFTGRGTVVWGARTLDGNSNDWRYIQIRRTLIYIEQSIKNALNPFVFAANDGTTWTTVVSMVSSFLQGLWSQGGLMGATASEAFTVECGLGSTMTAQDILDGYMIVQVTLQMIRPAEFIELTFKQKMEGAG